MIKITKLNEIYNLPLTFNSVKGILISRLEKLITEYNVDDISSFGQFILLESSVEIENYKQMNLTEPIVRNDLEWVEIINSEFINICIVRDDSYSVNIIISNLLIDVNIKHIIGGQFDEKY